eukprot:882396_1
MLPLPTADLRLIARDLGYLATSAVANERDITHPMKKFGDFATTGIVNWAASSAKLGTELRPMDGDQTHGPKVVSSGHLTPFYGPSNAIDDIFMCFDIRL